MADVIVIGGGIVGASAAWQLAELGADVTLLERGALASGATARSQGLLLPPDHAELQPVFDETIRLYRRLAAETGIDFALDAEPIGTLMLATTDEQLAELRARRRTGACCWITTRCCARSRRWRRTSPAACSTPTASAPTRAR